MKRNTYFSLYFIFIISTIISLVIVYKDITNSFTLKFLVSYMIFTFIFLIYFICISLFKLSKLKFAIIKQRLIKFIALSLLFIAFDYLLGFIFGASQNNSIRHLCSSIGLAFGICFIDLLFTDDVNTK